MNQSNCRNCGQLIGFIRTEKGRLMPVDPEIIPYMEGGDQKLINEYGRVVACHFPESGETADGNGYMPHFATCKARGKGKRRRRA